MKRNIRGNLVEYVLPIVTTGVIFGLGVMGFAHADLMGNFWAKSVDGQMDTTNKLISMGKKSGLNSLWGQAKETPIQIDITPTGPLPGFLGGTPTNPQSLCNNGSCTIDFGDFVLNGVPDNFNQVVESTGAAGGSDSIMSVLTQLATELEEQGLTSEANSIKDLANLGHNIARIEEELEKGIVGCNNDSSCIWSLLNDSTMNTPDGFNTQVGYFPPGISYDEAKEGITLGGARAILNGMEPYTGSRPMEEIPSFQYMMKYDEIMGNAQVNDTIKALVQQLTWTLGKVAEDFDDFTWATTHPEFEGTTQTGYIRDTLTGGKTYPVMDFTQTNVFDHFNNYNASDVSDVTSALECSVGGSIDSGTQCNDA